jgi:hypothetical protein
VVVSHNAAATCAPLQRVSVTGLGWQLLAVRALTPTDVLVCFAASWGV